MKFNYSVCKVFLWALFISLSVASGLDASGASNEDPDPAFSSINIELLSGANAIVRQDHRRFEFRGLGEGRFYIKKMVTILNASGLSHASISIPYNNFIDIKNLGGAVYDAEGNRVRRIRSRDLDDESMVSSYSLAEDSRIKSGNFTHSSYPFTVEIEYRLDFSGYIQLPSWIPVDSEKTALESGLLDVIMPTDVEVDYRTFKLPDDSFSKSTDGDEVHYSWELNDLKAIERENMGPPWFELLPAVILRSELFSMEGNEGSMKDWNLFASWFGKLWADRDELPNSVKEVVDGMIEEHGVSLELIHEIYNYLQSNTRYVSIQLGIGGFQTEMADITARNRYGDCKALSNYMLAMLRHAGFEARPALIRNGSYLFPFDPEFVHNPFNHVVIAVDFEGERIWVEATSTLLPLGYIGSSNSNRYALFFNEQGGELVRTPSLKAEDNFQLRNATVNILDDGSADVSVYTQYGGSQHEWVRGLSAQLPRTQNRNLMNLFSYNLVDLEDVEIGADLREPTAFIDMEVAIQTFSNKIGNRLMFYPNLMERYSNFLSSDENRTQSVYFGSAYHDIDEISYQIPEGYTIEAIPDSVNLELFEYATFSSSVAQSEDGKKLHYKREIIMKPGVIPVEEYETYRLFMNDITRSDQGQVVLVKN